MTCDCIFLTRKDEEARDRIPAKKTTFIIQSNPSILKKSIQVLLLIVLCSHAVYIVQLERFLVEECHGK